VKLAQYFSKKNKFMAKYVVTKLFETNVDGYLCKIFGGDVVEGEPTKGGVSIKERGWKLVDKKDVRKEMTVDVPMEYLREYTLKDSLTSKHNVKYIGAGALATCGYSFYDY
jgi:hypothetical protein